MKQQFPRDTRRKWPSPKGDGYIIKPRGDQQKSRLPQPQNKVGGNFKSKRVLATLNQAGLSGGIAACDLPILKKIRGMSIKKLTIGTKFKTFP